MPASDPNLGYELRRVRSDATAGRWRYQQAHTEIEAMKAVADALGQWRRDEITTSAALAAIHEALALSELLGEPVPAGEPALAPEPGVTPGPNSSSGSCKNARGCAVSKGRQTTSPAQAAVALELNEAQLALLRYFADGRECSKPHQHAAAWAWAKRKGYIENTGRTSGIANTVGGVQWLHRITAAGRGALATIHAERERAGGGQQPSTTIQRIAP